MRRPPVWIALVAVFAVVVAACGGDDDAAEADGMHMDDDVSAIGAPADAADADRVVELTMSDDMTFSPDVVEVERGETITFRVTNAGETDHEFMIGDDAMHAAHEEEMAALGSGEAMASEPNAMMIEPGASMEMSWTFSEAGEIGFACHMPGHYAAGMQGMIDVGESPSTSGG